MSTNMQHDTEEQEQTSGTDDHDDMSQTFESEDTTDAPFRPPGPQHLICNVGQNIIEQGTPSHQAFIIDEGRAEVLVEQDGETVKIADIGPGEIFGEMGVLEDTARMATVRATEKSKVLVISRREIEDKLDKIDDPAIRSIINVLMKRLRDTNNRQISHQKEAAALRSRILGLAEKAESGIDERHKQEFQREITPLLEKMEQLLAKYQT